MIKLKSTIYKKYQPSQNNYFPTMHFFFLSFDLWFLFKLTFWELSIYLHWIFQMPCFVACSSDISIMSSSSWKMLHKMLIIIFWLVISMQLVDAHMPRRILIDTDMDTDELFAVLYLLKLNRSEYDLKVWLSSFFSLRKKINKLYMIWIHYNSINCTWFVLEVSLWNFISLSYINNKNVSFTYDSAV